MPSFHRSSTRLKEDFDDAQFLVSTDERRPGNESAFQVIETALSIYSKKLKDGILHLPEGVLDEQLTTSRRAQAVVVGGSEFYLPLPKSGHLLLPSILLRCSFFRGKVEGGAATRRGSGELPCLVRSDSLVFDLLPHLGAQERNVLAACLSAYGERALGSGPDDWVTLSLYQVAKKLGVSHSTRMNEGIMASLERLAAVRFHQVKASKTRVAIDFLLQFQVDSVEGSHHRVRIRVGQQLAYLFGLGQWVSVHPDVLRIKGLAGWLACFYLTHSEPYPHDVSRLAVFAGLTGTHKTNARKMKEALTSLTADDVHPSVRVERFEFTEDQKLIVKRCAWREAKGGAKKLMTEPSPE